MEKLTPAYIDKPFFPDDLHIAMTPLRHRIGTAEGETGELISGERLMHSIITECYKNGEPEFVTAKYEKPSATLNGKVLSVSFSHTTDSVCAAVSRKWVVGVDMESTARAVSPGLKNRMKHPDEKLKFYENEPIIKIWTMKESALKAIGTGLRKPMNSVQLEAESENSYKVSFFNGIKANICSFKCDGQWIALCYISSKLSESFLPQAYVPIHTGRDKKSPG